MGKAWDENAKSGAHALGDAINAAIGASAEVADAIERLRMSGFEPQLTLKLEIALAQAVESGEGDERELNLTQDDLKTLQRLRIRVD